MTLEPALDGREADLVRRIGEGDRTAALGELYDLYGGRLYGLGLRMLADRGLAEELVQETFVRVWRAAAGFDASKGTVRGWIFTIGRRVAIDLHRRRRPGRELHDGALPELGAMDGQLDALLLELTLREAMDALSPAHRQALELAYQHDLSQSEIAERLGVPLGTVKSRTHTALRVMREALAERGVDA